MLSWIAAGVLFAAQAGSISGVVTDASGAAVSGAVVVVRAAAAPDRRTLTGADGRFVVDAAIGGDVTLIVRAGGFREASRPVTDADRGRDLDISLELSPLAETVTITATRSERASADVPASVQVLDRDQLSRSPAVVADDVLRQVPTFSLFRRTSSTSVRLTPLGPMPRSDTPCAVG